MPANEDTNLLEDVSADAPQLAANRDAEALVHVVLIGAAGISLLVIIGSEQISDGLQTSYLIGICIVLPAMMLAGLLRLLWIRGVRFRVITSRTSPPRALPRPGRGAAGRGRPA